MLSSLDKHCSCKTIRDFILGAGSGMQSIGCVVEGLQVGEEPVDIVVNVCPAFRPKEPVKCLGVGDSGGFLARGNGLLVQLVSCDAFMVPGSHCRFEATQDDVLCAYLTNCPLFNCLCVRVSCCEKLGRACFQAFDVTHRSVHRSDVRVIMKNMSNDIVLCELGLKVIYPVVEGDSVC